MDAEQDMGGLPAWLLKHKFVSLRCIVLVEVSSFRDIKLRTSDPRYTAAVERYYRKLLPDVVKPLLYPNGGPVLMVQVENEYGSYYTCDRKYTSWLTNLTKNLLATDKIVYFSVDGSDVGSREV